MKRIKKIIEQMENAMAAASFAQAGEFDTARDMLKEERRVLLALKEGRIDAKTLKYALNTCTRIKAALDILYVSSESSRVPGAGSDGLLDHFLSELEAGGIPYTMVRKAGCLKQQIIEYTNDNSAVLFVVIESSDDLDVDCTGKDKKLSGFWRNLKCPLVVVMDGARA